MNENKIHPNTQKIEKIDEEEDRIVVSDNEDNLENELYEEIEQKVIYELQHKNDPDAIIELIHNN